jgi:hypothetical protein
MLDVLSKAAVVAALICLGACNYLVLKVLDERRGKSLTALQVVLNPLMIDQQLLTDAGRRHHRRLLTLWFLAVACMGLVLLLSFIDKP